MLMIPTDLVKVGESFKIKLFPINLDVTAVDVHRQGMSHSPKCITGSYCICIHDYRPAYITLIQKIQLYFK